MDDPLGTEPYRAKLQQHSHHLFVLKSANLLQKRDFSGLRDLMQNDIIKVNIKSRNQKTWLRFTSFLYFRIQMILKSKNWTQNAIKLLQMSYLCTLRNILINLECIFSRKLENRNWVFPTTSPSHDCMNKDWENQFQFSNFLEEAFSNITVISQQISTL